MELSLSLGDSFMASQTSTTTTIAPQCPSVRKTAAAEAKDSEQSNYNEPSLQLNLLPLRSFSAASENRNYEAVVVRGFDVNRPATAEEAVESSSSPNSSTVSSFQLELSAHVSSGGEGGVAGEGGASGAVEPSSIGSDDDENGAARKKLRLSKDQSAFLEESFQEHSTLNPKWKVALAKQLNLQPRQVEVWFQNRRARSKLKQTEVDCEYLKRCCEKLTEENHRLQRELAELRALKASHPYYTHLPATTLSMCPSCERVASTNSSANTTAGATAAGPSAPAVPGEQRPNSFAALFSKSRLFAGPQPLAPSQRPKATS